MVRRWVPALALGGMWWWAVLRLALQPEQAGVVEGAVAAGGWGLSLLPVHVASMVSAGRASEARLERPASGVGPASGVRPEGRAPRVGAGRLVAGLTRAWRRRRSGGGSGRW
ncbi:hypothetical protein NJO91_20880 [Streptomyces microflavus]|uniref:hypothetical protein n=1 Tax=Streptomyces microflavus TaxID=1919 RepID=UPI0029B68A34|nr:hypothetical protein [Streptomyces microflavus]MDX2405561.1 hypothetical protein [Streptomyces microflavus]